MGTLTGDSNRGSTSARDGADHAAADAKRLAVAESTGASSDIGEGGKKVGRGEKGASNAGHWRSLAVTAGYSKTYPGQGRYALTRFDVRGRGTVRVPPPTPPPTPQRQHLVGMTTTPVGRRWSRVGAR